ncbi:MAG: hypothetical protein VX944_02770 [Myxococcota bacterium]|nr:hypothetical protein [Myxococcota bacterium]
MKIRFAIVGLVALGLSPVATAGEFFLELSEHDDRETAEAALLEYGPDGEHMRISRRFIRGTGWRYVVRLDGFEDRESAVLAAQSFSSATGDVRVIEGLGYKRSVVATVGDPEGQPEAPEAESAAGGGLPSASAVLKSAAKAHGGRSGGARTLAKTTSLRFDFTSRTVVGEKDWRIRHRYFRAAERARLEVDMVKGDGVSNTVVMGEAGKAWVATHAMVRERDTLQAAEMLARFAPETGLLSIPLGFAVDIKEASEWQNLATAGRVNHVGTPHIRLVPKAGEQSNPLEAALFEETTGLLSRVTWVTRGGRVTFEFRDYRTVTEGVVLPFQVRVERNGGLVEEVTVEALEINPALSNELFGEPKQLRGKKR